MGPLPQLSWCALVIAASTHLPSCHPQVDIDQLDQGSTDNRRKKKANRDPNQPSFELTSTQYAAPFFLTSIGKQPTVNECLYQLCVAAID